MQKSSQNHFVFHSDYTDVINSYTIVREGELRIGEELSSNWQHEGVKYVVIGIAESIGAQANFGRKGAEKSFDAFLQFFCNMQITANINSSKFALYGKIEACHDFKDLKTGREWVGELDEFVFNLLTPIVQSGKIPIVIGGGHNNAYPLIKATSLKTKDLVVVNMDAHADCRALEGRHSGNPFSYALTESLLKKYAVFGLHKAYNNSEMIRFLHNYDTHFSYFEDYVFGIKNMINDLTKYLSELSENHYLGVELDLDSIENFPSSAMSPIGFTISDARLYIQLTRSFRNVAYYHLTEAAVIENKDERIVGKTLSQLVFDILAEN
jgi:formiminoglutamase